MIAAQMGYKDVVDVLLGVKDLDVNAQTMVRNLFAE